ncbi:MAG: outer membrane beta-barrel protein [Vicinamibacterales bacterium]
MTLARYILAASVLLSPTLAHAQDFGVMESAETINKGNFKLKVNPMFILRSNDTQTGIVGGVGYGFTDRFDFEANFARYKDVTLVGGNVEYWLIKGQAPLDLSASAGFHLAKSDFVDETGVDLTVIASHAATNKLDVYAALDMTFNKYRDNFPNNSYTQAHLVPGVEYKVHQDLDLVAEFGVALNDKGDNYVSFGLAYYVR